MYTIGATTISGCAFIVGESLVCLSSILHLSNDRRGKASFRITLALCPIFVANRTGLILVLSGATCQPLLVRLPSTARVDVMRRSCDSLAARKSMELKMANIEVRPPS